MVYRIQQIEIKSVKLKGAEFIFELSNGRSVPLISSDLCGAIKEEEKLIVEDIRRMIEKRDKHRTKVKDYYDTNKIELNAKRKKEE